MVNLKTYKTKNRKEKKRTKQGHIYNPFQKITKLVVVVILIKKTKLVVVIGNRGYKKKKNEIERTVIKFIQAN